jgi:hypothetical protein
VANNKLIRPKTRPTTSASQLLFPQGSKLAEEEIQNLLVHWIVPRLIQTFLIGPAPILPSGCDLRTESKDVVDRHLRKGPRSETSLPTNQKECAS